MKKTPGSICAVRESPPASGVTTKCSWQKFSRKAVSVFAPELGRHHPVVVAGERDDRRGIVAIWLVELVVVVGTLAEAVDDVAEMEEEARRVVGVGVVEVGGHLVGDAVLRLRSARAAGIADGVEDELAGRFDGVDRLLIAVEQVGEGEPGFDTAARRGEGHGSEPVLAVERVDLAVGLAVGDVAHGEVPGIRRRFGLREDGAAERARLCQAPGLGLLGVPMPVPMLVLMRPSRHSRPHPLPGG